MCPFILLNFSSRVEISFIYDNGPLCRLAKGPECQKGGGSRCYCGLVTETTIEPSAFCPVTVAVTPWPATCTEWYGSAVL